MANNEILLNIYPWMIQVLGLKGCDLLIFAIIFRHTKNDESWYIKNLSEYSEMLGYNRATICISLRNLTKKGLIIKEAQTWQEDENQRTKYKINIDKVGVFMTDYNDYKDTELIYFI